MPRLSFRLLVGLGLALSFASVVQPSALAQVPPASTNPAGGASAAPPDETPAEEESAEKSPKAEEENLRIYDEVKVVGRASELVGIADSATEGVTGRAELNQRPILRPAEVLETVPGVIITQHSGSGKANQYFLRGFNLDHGTDFRVTVDGMPINMPSHGHGQGYADLNFLIPELVSTVEYRKGAYDASEGDFSAAGAAHLEYVDRLDRGIAQLTPGSFGYGRALVGDSRQLGGGNLLGAVEYVANDGPWKLPEDLKKVNGVLRYGRGDAANGFSLTAMGYDSSWDSTDQIPGRAVAEGLVSRFGAIDLSDGGSSSRYSLSFEGRRGTSAHLDRLQAYAIAYELDLFSNFTFFLDDPENGDQFEQTDRRTVVGFKLDRQWLAKVGERDVETTVGLEGRGDSIKNGLFHTAERARLGTTRQDDIRQFSAAPFAQALVHWRPWLRTVTGLRVDTYSANVDSDLEENSGSRRAALLSPKLSVLFGPWKATEVYLNYGYGFHSNDARGATIRVDPKTGDAVQRVDPLVRAKSFDFGVRTTAVRGLQTTVSLFALDLDSELLFVGDAGNTEASRPSRRTGIEVANFWRALPWLSLDLDVSLSRGRFRDDDPAGDRIPGAIERVAAVGVTLSDLGRLSGSVRLRYFGPRDLIEDGSVRSRSSSLVNARVAYLLGNHLEIGLELLNAFDARVSDIDYFYASRLQGEPDEGVEDIHFHPAEKRSARLIAQWRF